MATFRYTFPVIAMAAMSAASSCGSSGSTTTIQSQADATGLSSCRTYSGSIAISSSTTDSIALDGITSIGGSLIANNVTQMASLTAANIEEIGDSFSLQSLTILSTLSFPSLTKVNTIDWEALPALQGLTFTTGVQEVQMLTIVNTELASLEGIDLQVVDTMEITNNPYLTSINMQLGNATTSMTINSNGKDLAITFPNLMWAYNFTCGEAATVSIPSLTSVNGSLGFTDDSFESLIAPNLTTVGGSLSFSKCNSLTNISMPVLTTVGGGFSIANNTNLVAIDGFPELKTVGGALDFNGAFKNVTLPSLGDVRGAFNLQSSEDITSACDTFKAESGMNSVIKGKYTCASNLAHPGGAGTTPGATNTGSGDDSSTTSSAAVPMLIPGATGLLGVVAAIFGLL